MMPWSGYWSTYSILLQTKVGQGNLALLQLHFMPLCDEDGIEIITRALAWCVSRGTVL